MRRNTQPKFRSYAAVAVLTILLVGCAYPSAHAQTAAEHVVWIYHNVPTKTDEDKRTETERLFAPYGFMPAERASQISVNQSVPVDPADKSKGTCLDYKFKFKDTTDWVGSYMLLDSGIAWGTKQGINVQKLLDVPDDYKLALRFQAKGTGSVTFKIGGVTDGDHPSSLKFPLQTDNSPTSLNDDWQDYTIGPISASDLTNLIDPFCVVTSGQDNDGKSLVEAFVKDIRIEPFDKVASADPLPGDWRQQLSRTVWVCYTPTHYNPTVHPIQRPTQADIRADLSAIKGLATAAGIPEGKVGIITYGCKDGLDVVPVVAESMNIPVILGVFNPRDLEEILKAQDLLRRDDLRTTIVGCCVGNEAVTFRRATWGEIRDIAGKLRSTRNLPITTTEIVQSYGNRRAFDFDFTFPTVHAIFAGIRDPDIGAEWTVNQIKNLLAVAPPGQVILIKELGWPSGPAPFTREQQIRFWRNVMRDPAVRQVNICIFDGLANVDWKYEPIQTSNQVKVNVGPNWPALFGAERNPTAFAPELLRMWAKSRG